MKCKASRCTGQRIQTASVPDTMLTTGITALFSLTCALAVANVYSAQPLLDKLNIQPKIIEGLQEFDLLGFSCLKGASFEQRMAMTDAYWQGSPPNIPHAPDAESFQDSSVLPTTKKIYEDLEKLHTKKESLIEKLNQSRQEQDRLYQYKKNYDNYLGKEVER